MEYWIKFRSRVEFETMRKWSIYFYLFIWLCWVLVASRRIFSCGMWDLVPRPGIEPGLPALGAWSLYYWTPGKLIFVNLHWKFFKKKKKKSLNLLKRHRVVTSLVVQCLGLSALNTGALVWSLVRKLDPTCCNQELRVQMPLIPHTATKIPYAPAKTQCSQINR